MSWLRPATLQSEPVTQEPLGRRHHDDLALAVRDGKLWRLCYTTVPAPDGMRAEIGRRLGLQATGAMLPFAVID